MEKLPNGVKEYAQKRDQLIDYITNLTKEVWGNDKDMIDGVKNLTSSLKLADVNYEFVNGMLGFINYVENYVENKERFSKSSVLATLIHDLGEFSRNRHRPWFSPRTSDYQKYAAQAPAINSAIKHT